MGKATTIWMTAVWIRVLVLGLTWRDGLLLTVVALFLPFLIQLFQLLA